MSAASRVGVDVASDIPFPNTEHDFTPAWFTAALAERYPGVEVTSAELVHRIGGTAAKFRFRLRYAVPQGPAGAPETLWAKGGFETGGADQGDAFANEVRFYRDLAPTLGVNVPNCYFGAVDAKTNNGLILLEDLLNRGATFGRATTPLTFAQTSAVLDMQARYHARYWGDPALAEFPWLKAGGSIAGSGMVEQFFAGFWDASTKLPRFQWVPESLRDKDRVRDALSQMIERDARDAFCLAHGDSQCANLFFNGDGAPGYLDWQHVMRGHWAFDFAHMVVTGMTVADRRIHERTLLESYRDKLIELGVAAPPLQDMWRDYQSHAVWAFMWVMCPVSAHPEEVCTLNSERACAAMTDLDSLALYD